MSDLIRDEKKINNVVIKKPNNKAKQIKIQGITKNELIKLVKQGNEPFSSVKDLQVIYDPERILSELKNRKEVNNSQNK